MTEAGALGGAAAGIVLSAAISAALGGGMVGAHTGVKAALEVPVCTRCWWHCRVHEFGLVAAVLGGAAGGLALNMLHLRLSQPGPFSAARFLLIFVPGAALGALLTYLACTFILAFPTSHCASRWLPVWCAEAGSEAMEFSFASHAFAREFAALNANRPAEEGGLDRTA